MPRDVNGNYSLPVGNPVQSGTLIESNWANITMDDLAAEITDSLSRSGKGGLTGPLGIVDKSGSVPGINFINEPTSGLKREATADVRLQVQGVDAARFTTGIQYVRDSGSLKQVVVEESGQKIFRGQDGVTTCWFFNETVPTGWVFVNPDAFVRNLTIGTVELVGGQTYGSQDPRDLTHTVSTTVTVDLPAVTGDTALTNAQIPAHTHDEGAHSEFGSGTAVETGLQSNDGSNFLGKRFRTSITGGGSPHSHPIGGQATGTGTGTTDTLQPRHAAGVFGRL